MFFVCYWFSYVTQTDEAYKSHFKENWTGLSLDEAFFLKDLVSKEHKNAGIKDIREKFQKLVSDKVVANLGQSKLMRTKIKNPKFKSLKRLKFAKFCAAKAPQRNVKK